MSETVHYRGKAVEITATEFETLEQYAEKVCKHWQLKMNDYVKDHHNGSWVFLLADELYTEYVRLQDGRLFKIINKVEVPTYEDIIVAKQLPNKIVEFELKYYNGGAGFNECFEEAVGKIK